MEVVCEVYFLHTMSGYCYLIPVWDISILKPPICACANVIPHPKLLSYDNNNHNNNNNN